MAWLHGFDDPLDPMVHDGWHPRLEPFNVQQECQATKTRIKKGHLPGQRRALCHRTFYAVMLRTTWFSEIQQLGFGSLAPEGHGSLPNDATRGVSRIRTWDNLPAKVNQEVITIDILKPQE